MRNILSSLVLLFLPILLCSQNIVIRNGDATDFMQNILSNDITIGNPCGVEYFSDLFIQGDYTLVDNIVIQNARVTVYGVVNLNGFTVTYKCPNSEWLVDDSTLSVPDTTPITKVKVYPNPTNGVFYVSTEKPYMVRVYDMTGKIVSETPDLRGLPSGTYLAYITIENIRLTKKIIKR